MKYFQQTNHLLKAYYYVYHLLTHIQPWSHHYHQTTLVLQAPRLLQQFETTISIIITTYLGNNSNSTTLNMTSLYVYLLALLINIHQLLLVCNKVIFIFGTAYDQSMVSLSFFVKLGSLIWYFYYLTLFIYK